jgi:predicted permease
VAVISHALWLGRFGGSPTVIGRTIDLDRIPFTIIGVLPSSLPDLVVGSRVDIMAPVQLEPLVSRELSRLTSGRQPFLNVMLRLRQGDSVAHLTTALRSDQADIRTATIGAMRSPAERERHLASPWLVVAAPAGSPLAGSYYGRPAAIALGIGALVLLACCTNVAMVLLAHGARRRHELSVRVALGAPAAEAARQLMVDGLALTGPGAGAGLLMAMWAGPWLAAQMTASGALPQTGDVATNWRVWLFASGLGLATGLICATAAAQRAARIDAVESLKSSDPRHRAPTRIQSFAIVAQLAVSVVAIATSGLLLRSYAGVARAAAASGVEGLVAVELQLHKSGVRPEARPAVVERLAAAVRAIPGVATTLSMNAPQVFGGGGYFWAINADDGAATPFEKHALVNAVAPSFFDLVHAALVAGRRFDTSDVKGAPRVGIASRGFARKFLGGDTQVPGQVRVGTGKDAYDLAIVGVVDDLPDLWVGELPQPTLYLPRDQDVIEDGIIYILIRSTTRGPVPEAPIHAAVDTAAPDLSYQVQRVWDEVRRSLARERMLAWLAVFFVVLTALVAVVGVFGVMSFDVATRQREIGVRLAVGARPVQVA